MPVPVPTEAAHLSGEVIGVLSALGASALTALGAFVKSRQQAKKDATTVDLDRDKLRYEVMQREHTDTRQLSEQFRSLMQSELSRLRARTEEQNKEIEDLQSERRKLRDQNAVLETESRVLEVRRQALITQYELELDNLRTALFQREPTAPVPAFGHGHGHGQSQNQEQRAALPASSPTFVSPPPTNPQLLALGGTETLKLTRVPVRSPSSRPEPLLQSRGDYDHDPNEPSDDGAGERANQLRKPQRH